MLTLTTGESVTILGYAPWDETNEKMGEFVRIKVADEERTRRYTVDKALNGEKPAEGATARLIFAERMEPKARQGRNGLYTVFVEKRRVVGFADVKVAPAKAA
jgi:hypothetical protein